MDCSISNRERFPSAKLPSDLAERKFFRQQFREISANKLVEILFMKIPLLDILRQWSSVSRQMIFIEDDGFQRRCKGLLDDEELCALDHSDECKEDGAPPSAVTRQQLLLRASCRCDSAGSVSAH